jgi:type I restriction enzyme S subunit
MSQMLRLDKVAEVGSGNSAPQDEELFNGGYLPFVRTSDVGAIHIGSIETSRDLLTLAGARGLKLQPSGTILFPKSGASTFLNHRVFLSRDAYVSSHLATIKANNELRDIRIKYNENEIELIRLQGKSEFSLTELNVGRNKKAAQNFELLFYFD